MLRKKTKVIVLIIFAITLLSFAKMSFNTRRHVGVTRLEEDTELTASKSSELDMCRKQIWVKINQLNISTNREHQQVTQKPNCNTYRQASKIHHQVVSNVLNSPNITDRNKVTMVTHLTSDRYYKLLDMMKNWKGPVSASIYVKEKGLNAFVDKLCLTYNEYKWSEFRLHFIKEETVLYPINYLRNVALKDTQTDYLFVIDADFVPMPNAYHILQNYIQTRKLRKNEAFIVPGFEFTENKPLHMKNFPRNKEELLVQWKQESVRPFHYVSFVHGQKPTNLTRWMNATEPYQVQWKRWYEPLFVIRKDSSPLYDERFVGRGYNRSSYTMQLYAMRFIFLVLPDVYVVHTPHSLELVNWFKALGLYGCAASAEREFIQMMKRKYNFTVKKEDIPKLKKL